MRVFAVLIMSGLLVGCGGGGYMSYLGLGIELAQEPSKAIANFYEKQKEERDRARRELNIANLKAELDLQECGAVFYWLSGYYQRHDTTQSQRDAAFRRKYTVTGIDRYFLRRVLLNRLAMETTLSAGRMEDVFWVAEQTNLVTKSMKSALNKSEILPVEGQYGLGDISFSDCRSR